MRPSSPRKAPGQAGKYQRANLIECWLNAKLCLRSQLTTGKNTLCLKKF
jgi:hypothetical protein